MRTATRFILRQVKARPLACLAVCFLLGLLLRRQIPAPTAVCALALAAAVGAVFAALRDRRALAAALIAAGLLGGMTRMGVALDAFKPVETRYSVVMTGRVESEPFLNPSSGRLIFRLRVEDVDGGAEDMCLRMYLRGDEPLLAPFEYGQRLRLKGHIWKSDPVTNPHEFDFGDYLHRQGMDAYATAKAEDVEIIGQTTDLRAAVIVARQAIARRIDALFPRNAGMMRALVLGDRSMLSDELRASLNETGTAHLISISGLHVTVLAALVALILSLFISRRRANIIAAALLLPYGALIGFTAPFARALVMFAVLCFAPMAGRPSDPITRLCAAMLLWLSLNPLSVADAGFALSFSASAGILLLTPPLERLTGVAAMRSARPSPSRARRAAKKIALYAPSLLCASLAAQLATLPSVVAFFGVQSVIALPFSLVCVPLCMLGYVAGVFALLLSAISMPLAALLARFPDAVFTLLFAVTRLSERLPVAGVRIGRYSAALVLAHWIVAISASGLSRVRLSARRLMPFSLLLIAALASLLTFARAWPTDIVFLDADQADCAVLTTRGHTWLIDAGDTYTPAADYLSATCLHLDGVVLSHPHQDHAGGLKQVLDCFCPDAIYVPRGWFDVEINSPAVTEGIDLAKEMGVEIVELSAGDTVRLSAAASMDVLAPGCGALPEDVNDLSILASITCEGRRALFTGDLGAEAEPDDIPDADVLKVAHHGGGRATSERFLNACTPEIAVISVGENNYGHPVPETLDKLRAVGSAIYLTRERGAITVSLRNGSWRVKTYLEAPDEVE